MSSLLNPADGAFDTYGKWVPHGTPALTPAQDAIEQADSYLSNAILPTYSELLAALRAMDDQAGHTMHKPAGQKAYSAVVVPRATMESARALLARHDRTMSGDFGA